MNPAPLAEIISFFSSLDPFTRAELLTEYAERFEQVPPSVAVPPFDNSHRVPGCESEVYIWGVPAANPHTLKFYFAVQNPFGVSAKALAVILDEALSGLDVSAVSNVSSQFVHSLFGSQLSMGKGQGLMSMVECARLLAQRELDRLSL